MLRAAVILSLAMAAMAAVTHKGETVPEQVIRIGSVGISYVNINGIIEPNRGHDIGGIPSYKFKCLENGVPVTEEENINFRCSRINDFYAPHGENPKPVLICRNEAFQKTSVADSTIPKRAFLFSAERFNLPEGADDMYLSLGKRVWRRLQEVHTSVVSTGISVTDTVKGHVLKDVEKPILDIPTRSRVKRQFGLGFSGSGAQASSSSFGGGGGFGGFPGGGFGGGFSGSQASAGSSSFGGGGGGFFG